MESATRATIINDAGNLEITSNTLNMFHDTGKFFKGFIYIIFKNF